jgi:MFS family permease
MLDRLGLNALGYSPFRIFFVSNFLSNSSMFVFNAGLGWYVLTVTDSPAAVGFAFFVNGLPWLLLMAHAGLLTDRYGPKPLVAISYALTGTAMLCMALLALTPEPPLALVIALAFLVGTFMTIGAPGFISIVNELVPAGAVSSAVSLNFLGISVGRVAGGILGGLLIGLGPAGWALGAAALLQAAPAPFIWRLRTAPVERSPQTERGLFRPLVDAAGYARRHPTLGVILLLSAGPGILGLSYNFILPVAAQEMGIGPEGLGLLLAASGVGGLIAGFTAEGVMRRFGHGRTVFLGLATSSLGLTVFGLTPVPLLGVALVAIACVGGGFLIYSAASLSLVQALAPAALRGRLTGLFTLLYWGLMPVGGLLGGAAAELWTARTTIAAAGLILLGCGILAVVGRPEAFTLRVERDGTLRGAGRGDGDDAGSGEAGATPLAA